MKFFLTLVIVLGAAASAGAQGTKAPAKPDSSKTKAATSSAKAPVTPPGKAVDPKQTATKQTPPGTKAADTKQAPVGTKAADTKQAVPVTKQLESPTGTA